jgi:RNA polymerase sigma-70 factor (ECF subfamily)
LARRIGLPDAETEDAVHEVFTELWRNGNRYDPNIASETAFVATIARRRLIDRRRRLGRQPVRQQLTDAEPEREVSRPRNEVGEEAARAAKAFEQLTPEQQRVLRLSVYEGLSHELISRSTGLPLGTVKTHARRGLIRLREMLNKDKPGDSSPESAADRNEQTSPPSVERGS